MQATLVVECACGAVAFRVAMDTADLSIPGAWERKGREVRDLLYAHRRGFCAVYNPAAAATPKVHLRSPRFRQMPPR